MNTLEVSQAIVDVLNNIDLGIESKVNPIAPFASQSYSVTEPKGTILVYLDTIKGYEPPRRMVDGRHSRELKKVSRFAIAVGVRKAEELDALCETIEGALSFLALGNGTEELMPVAWSKMSKSEDAVYWRQLWFETTISRRLI